ncbi:MAG TPA: translocation/assembly module TamB domain-containing protein [Gemmatimonadaceae bacterium]|nr:translocation/assembly module TamB domain-containing protein [Gemmatimonadaceae bacterium]
MSRRRVVVLASAGVLLVLGLLAALVVVGVTQTAYGRRVVRDLVQEQVADRIHGRLYLGTITGGLLTGVTIDSIEIRGPDDSLFVAAGPITLRYDPRDILDRRLLLEHVTVTRPVVHLKRYENGQWNFRRIFPSGPKAPPGQHRRSFGDFVVIDSATVVDGQFLLTMPWHPADSLRGARRDSAVAFNLAREDAEIGWTLDAPTSNDTAYARTWRWTDIDWASSGVQLASPTVTGRRFEIARMAVRESDPPVAVRNMRGEVRLHGDSVWLDIPHFDLPASTGSATGKIWWGSGLPVRYDIRVMGDSVSLRDVAWVYPTLPRTGGGSMLLEIHNDPDDLHVLQYALHELDVRTTGSRLLGRMTYGVGGPVLAVTDVALRAEPVDVDLLRTLAGGPFPYDWQGTLTGMVRGRGGPLTRFRVDSASLVFRDAHVPGAVTRGSGRGELDIRDPALAVFRGFRVNVDQLDLRTIEYVNPEFPRLGGVVSGRATLDSSWLDVRFRDADVLHRDGVADPSRFTGNGRVTLGDDFIRYDVDLVAQPLSFTTLARSYPAMPLRGSYVGPLRVQGTLDDLQLMTLLTGAGGELGVEGRFDLFGPRYAAAGTLTTSHLDLATLLNRLDVPPTLLTSRSTFDLAGDSLATLGGTLAVELDRSLVDSVRVHPSLVRAAFGDGRMAIDTLHLASSALTLSATGGLGLVASQPDSVAYELRVDSLGGLRRYLLADAEPGAAVDSLTGALTVSGVLSGSAEGVGLTGLVRGSGFNVTGTRAARLDGQFALADVLGRPRGPVRLTLDTATVAGVRLASATLTADVRSAEAARVRLETRSATGPRAVVTADLHHAGDSTLVAIDTASVLVGGDRWRLERPTQLRLDRYGLTLDSLALRGDSGGRVVAAGVIPVVDSLVFGVRAGAVPLRDVGLLAQSATSLDGTGAFALDLRGLRATPTMTFDGALAGARFGDVRLARATLHGSYAEERLHAELGLARGDTVLLRAQATLPLDLALMPRRQRVLDEPIDGDIRSERVDLSVLEGFTTAVRDASGTFTLNLDLDGTLRRPALQGALQVTDGTLTLPQAGITLRRVGADVAFLGDSVAIRRLSAASGRERDASLTLAGGIGLADYADPTFDLTLTARDFHAVDRPRLADLDISTTPDLRLTGRLSDATLSGGVRVERGTIYLPEFSRKQVVDLDDPEFLSLVDTTMFADRSVLPGAPSALLRNLTLRGVGIEMGDDVWLRGPEASINLGGRVNVTTARDPRSRTGETSLALDGILTANRGTYRLNLGVVQRTFVIERGSLRFFGEPDLNPTLDIVAVHTVRQFDRQSARQDVEVRAVIGGTLSRPQLKLTGGFAGGESGLTLSESDAVSYLVTGAPSFALGADQSSEVTAARLALASLGSYLGDRAAGGLFDVVQFQTSGLESSDTQSLRSVGAGILAGTRLDVGRQLTDRVYVSANAGLCQLGNVVGGASFNAQDFAESIGVKVDYRLGGGLSLSAGVEPPTSQLFCSRQINARGFTPTPRQWTFDLFKTWRF